MKILKWLLLGLVLLLVVLFFAAQIIINKPFVREKIVSTISSQINRDVSLAGMSVSFFPSISVNLKDFKIKEADGISDFVSLEKLRVRAELFSLLKKKLVVKELSLVKPSISVIKDAQGLFNFQSLIATPKKAEPSSAKSGAAWDLRVDAISIHDAQLSFRQESVSGEAQTFKVEDLNLKVDDLSLDRPISASISAKIAEHVLFDLKGRFGPVQAKPEEIQIDAEITLDGLGVEDLLALVPKNQLQGIWFSDLVVQGMLKGSLKEGIEASLKLKTAPLDDKNTLAMDLDLVVDALFNVEDPLASDIKADLKIRDISYKVAALNGDFKLKGALQVKTPDEITLTDLSLVIGSSDLTMSGALKNLEAPQIDFKLESKNINIDDFFIGGAAQV